MAQPPQVPNFANINAAINGMRAENNTIAQSVQAHHAHQQALTNELALCSNFPVAQILRELAAIRADIRELSDTSAARDWNTNAKMENSYARRAADNLIVMRSIHRGPNAPVAVNQDIPQFPATVDDVAQLSVAHCRTILTALQAPIHQNPNPQIREFRTAVRRAIGLPA